MSTNKLFYRTGRLPYQFETMSHDATGNVLNPFRAVQSMTSTPSESRFFLVLKMLHRSHKRGAYHADYKDTPEIYVDPKNARAFLLTKLSYHIVVPYHIVVSCSV